MAMMRILRSGLVKSQFLPRASLHLGIHTNATPGDSEALMGWKDKAHGREQELQSAHELESHLAEQLMLGIAECKALNALYHEKKKLIPIWQAQLTQERFECNLLRSIIRVLTYEHQDIRKLVEVIADENHHVVKDFDKLPSGETKRFMDNLNKDTLGKALEKGITGKGGTGNSTYEWTNTVERFWKENEDVREMIKQIEGEISVPTRGVS